MASFNRNVSDRDQDPPSWHGQSHQAGMASLNSWHGQSHQAGMASRNKLVWPALTRELLAVTKNMQTVAGMAIPRSLRQGPESDPSWHGQSQQQCLWQEPRTIHSWHG